MYQQRSVFTDNQKANKSYLTLPFRNKAKKEGKNHLFLLFGHMMRSTEDHTFKYKVLSLENIMGNQIMREGRGRQKGGDRYDSGKLKNKHRDEETEIQKSKCAHQSDKVSQKRREREKALIGKSNKTKRRKMKLK